MKKYIISSLLIFSLAAVLMACDKSSNESTKETTAKVMSIAAEDLNKMIEAKDFTLINVHIPYAGEIPQTDLFIPFNEIESNISKLPQDKTSKIVVYCRSGSMSASASQELLALGYTNVYDVIGGMNAWTSAGFKLYEQQP